jgi:hypothetical protein
MAKKDENHSDFTFEKSRAEENKGPNSKINKVKIKLNSLPINDLQNKFEPLTALPSTSNHSLVNNK